MSDIITFLRNYDYNLCLVKGAIWTMDEAIDYIASYLVNRETWPSREAAYEQFSAIRADLIGAVVRGIDSGELFAEVVYKNGSNNENCDDSYAIDYRRSTLQPYIFINWVLANNIEVPSQFLKYVIEMKSRRSGYYEAIGLKKSTIHHERCRAVAALLWRLEPDLTIADMARRSEITEFGCEGQNYDVRTICRWLASLRDVRKPGRPRKDDREGGAAQLL